MGPVAGHLTAAGDTLPRHPSARRTTWPHMTGGRKQRTVNPLMGSGSFRLSFYIAGILAENDGERVKIFDEMRAFYNTRSKVVHGGTLEVRHRAHLDNYPALRGYVRQLLVAYMRLATTAGHGYEPRPLRKRLDSLLQDAQQRSALRAAMGLEQIVATNGP
jgi:hypothetical protein